MKIALINITDANSWFQIGLLCLQAYLKRQMPQHQVDIIEALFENPVRRVLAEKYDLVGISAMTAHYEAASLLAREIRAVSNAPIILGGVHISKLPESLRPCFDVGVVGEGEDTLCELVALYETSTTPSADQLAAINGLVFHDGQQLRQTPPRPPVDLSNYPPLDYSAIHPSYFERKAVNSFGRFGIESFVMTSRGCPFKCVFCASSHFWNKVRYFPVEWVIAEIKGLEARGVTLLHFADDLFACNKKRMKAISEKLRAEHLCERITYDCMGNAHLFDDETCELLKSMNVKVVFFGFESGNPRVLDYLKCHTSTVEENRAAVELCRRHGLDCWGNILIASPGETLEEMEDSIRFAAWAKSRGVTRICVAILVPFPGTPVWQTALKRGLVGVDMNFDRLKCDGKEVPAGMFVDDAMKPEFAKLRDRAFALVHTFKWKKAWSLVRDSPWDALKFTMGAPQALLRHMFVRTEP